MALDNVDNDLNEDMLNSMNPFNMKATPGQSLTSNPDETAPWDGPPEFTKVGAALDALVEEMLEPDRFVAIIQVLATKNISITTLAQIMLEEGFRAGRCNPDLMMLLAEPLIVILMAISERAEIRDYELYDGENNEVDDEEEIAITKDLRDSMKEDTFFRGISIPPVRKESVPEGVLEQIKEMPVPKQESLLAAPEENTSEESLLGRS